MSTVNEPNREPQPWPLGTDKPRRPWWQRWSVRVLLAFLVCVLPLGSYYAYRRYVAAENLRAAVAELDRTDPGWHLQDIEKARAAVPEKENSAVVVAKAHRLMPKSWPSPALSERIGKLAPQEQLDAEDIACLRTELDQSTALDEARKLATLPNGRNPITYKRNFIATSLTQAQNTRQVLALLRCDVLLQTQDGDLQGAVRSCRALLNAARAVGDEPMLITQLVRIAGVGITCQAVERVLAQGEPDPDDLVALQKLLAEEASFPRLLVALRGERAGTHELFDALECGEFGLEAVTGTRTSLSDRLRDFVEADYFRGQHPIYLALANEWVRIAALPEHERAQPLGVLEANFKSQPPGVVQLLLPAVSKIDLAARRTDGNLRCLEAALAAERYRRKHGRWPDTLEQLVPEFLAAVPLDPEDGAPLRFHKRPDRVVVYSVMKKQTPEAGMVAYDPDELPPPGVGVAVHLFDVPHRRQPPRPKPVIVDDDP